MKMRGVLNDQQPQGVTACEKCKRDVRDAFTRPLDGSCEVCSTAEMVAPVSAVPRSGFIDWCVREAEKASGPVYKFFPPARRWSLASMGEAAFKNYCRSELRKAERKPKPVRVPEILGRELAEKMGKALANRDARGRKEPIPYPEIYPQTGQAAAAGFNPDDFVVVTSH